MAANWTLTQVLQQLDSGRKWAGNTITYSFPGTSGGLFSQGEAAGFRPANSEQQALMLLAMATWDDLIPQGFAAGSPGSTNLEFGYTSTNIGFAHAYFPTNGSIWFNVTKPSLVNPVVGEYGFITFVHEVGHALGLNHMGDYNGDGNWSPSSYQDSVVLSIMSYFGPRYGAPIYSPEVMQADWVGADNQAYYAQTPMLNDVMAIQAMYGASSTTRTGDTVYGFGSNAGGSTGRLYDFSINRNPILTLFDSGGNDTLNLSGWTTPARISLEPGTYSSANEMTNNIAIAYNTVIENAEGGGGHDVIVGNSAANRLVGNAGNDELYGMAGDDILIGGFGDDFIDGGPGTDTAIFAGNFAAYTITITGSTVIVASATLGTDRVTGVERFQFADTLRTLDQLSPGADSTPPLLQSRSPIDDAAAVSTATHFVLAFNEAVKAGSGEITIFNADGTVFRRIAADDAAQVRYSGNTVTVDPAVDLLGGRGYYITVSAGAITDLAGNPYPGLAGSSAWNFTTSSSDTTPPALLQLTPADDSGNVARGANLVLQFSEPVVAGSGSFTIRAGGQVFRTIAVTDTTQVTIQGSLVTIDPGVDLPAGAAITVTADAGIVRDQAGNPYPGLLSQTAWNFTTSAASADDYPYSTDTPGVVTINGAAATGIIEVGGDRDLFRVQLTAGVAYTFELQRSASGGLADPYLVLFGPTPALPLLAEDDDSGGLGNSRLSFTPTTSGTHYLAVFNYDTVGTGSYTLRATTQDTQPPVITSRTPADNATLVAVGADLVVVFSEAVLRGNGAIRLLGSDGQVLREIRVDDSNAVRINGSTVTIDPGANLPANTEFSVNIDAGAFRDIAGNHFAGVSGLTSWNFRTAPVSAADDFPLSVNTTGVVAVNGAALPARIDYPNDGDLFKVSLVAGVTYRFDMIAPQSSPVDPYLVLYGRLPEVDFIDFDDDSGPLPFDSRLYFTPSATGLYYLGAWDYAEATGPYSISAVVPADDYLGSTASSGRLTVNGSVTGIINVPTDVDFFQITLTAGVQYSFSLEAMSLDDPFLTLYNQLGVPLALDDDTGFALDSLLTYTAPTSGIYYLAAQDFDYGVGAYRLSAVARNVINGTPGNDNLVGTAGPDTLVGGAGSDRLRGNAGDDILQGGDGIDFAVYSGRTANFQLGPQGDNWYVSDTVGNQGRDVLYGVERLIFDDGPWAIDVEGALGVTAKVLGAVFGAASVDNENFVGIGLSLLDGGMSPQALMQLALEARLGARPSNAAVVDLLWFNLFGQQTPASERQLYTGLIANGSFTQASLALVAADTEWNLANIQWEDILLFGLPYQFAS